ncbi:Aste57867_11055 [Aphanomyces stellatus]|uniref:Aste57867_11055 protein n=1 Tax=Aphanomyces stellatus TaxID=120398 RepID=A0A485KSC9_9STRA|nr:hypothetical protein As57867_011013 [Aphanomyces stellatus]VFT87923.1 Aste57867_11055 [Aphanomyces stellatus]
MESPSLCRPYASETSDDDDPNVFAAADARKLRLLASVDQSEELKDYVLTTMRQLARMSSGLAMFLPTSSYKQGAFAALGDDAHVQSGADLMGRVWHGLHKVSASVNHLAQHVAGYDPVRDALDLTLLPPDPTMALEAIHAKLMLLRMKLDPQTDRVSATVLPLFQSAWTQGEDQARDHASASVACWKHAAADLQTRVKAAIATSPAPETALLVDVMSFLASMQVLQTPADQLASATLHRTQAIDLLVHQLQTALPPRPIEVPPPPPVRVDVPRYSHVRRQMLASQHLVTSPATSVTSVVSSAAAHTDHHAPPKKRPLQHGKEGLGEKKQRRPSTSPYASLSKERATKPSTTTHHLASPLPATASTPSSGPGRRKHVPTLDQKDEHDDETEDAAAAATPSDAVLAAYPRVVGCEKCHMNNNHDKMLLCDNNCGRGMSMTNNCCSPLVCVLSTEYHMYCLKPQLDVVPEDDWFCPECVKIPCLAVKCNRFCVFNERYCTRHLCKVKGCSYRCKKQGYCGKHSKVFVHDVLGGGDDDDDDADMDDPAANKSKW